MPNEQKGAKDLKNPHGQFVNQSFLSYPMLIEFSSIAIFSPRRRFQIPHRLEVAAWRTPRVLLGTQDLLQAAGRRFHDPHYFAGDRCLTSQSMALRSESC